MILASDKDRAIALDALQKINSGKKEEILHGFEIINSMLHTIVNSPAMFKDIAESAHVQNLVSRTEFYAYTEVSLDQYSSFISLGTNRKCDISEVFKEFFNASGLSEAYLRVRDARPNLNNPQEEEEEDEEDDDEDLEDDDEEEEDDEF